MKVAHIFWGLGFGGIETMLVNIANAQVRYGAEIHVILINALYEKTLLDKFSPQVKVHLLNRKLGSKGLGFIWRLNKELKAINPDKIHLHGACFYGMIFSRKYRHEASVTLHALPVEPVRHAALFHHWMSKLTCGIMYGEEMVTEVPKVFAISTAVQDAFREKYGIDSEVVHNGIMTSKFKRKEMYRSTPPLLRHTS